MKHKSFKKNKDYWKGQNYTLSISLDKKNEDTLIQYINESILHKKISEKKEHLGKGLQLTLDPESPHVGYGSVIISNRELGVYISKSVSEKYSTINLSFPSGALYDFCKVIYPLKYSDGICKELNEVNNWMMNVMKNIENSISFHFFLIGEDAYGCFMSDYSSNDYEYKITPNIIYYLNPFSDRFNTKIISNIKCTAKKENIKLIFSRFYESSGS